jgi:hypothetical protein
MHRRIPILDLYGVDDIEPVLKSVKERAQAAKENIHYTQKKVNADHFFNDKDEPQMPIYTTILAQ